MKKLGLLILLLTPLITCPWIKNIVLVAGGAGAYFLSIAGATTVKRNLDTRRESLFLQKAACEKVLEKGTHSIFNPRGLTSSEWDEAKIAWEAAKFRWAHPILSLFEKKK